MRQSRSDLNFNDRREYEIGSTPVVLGLCQGLSLDKVRDEDSFARRWCGRIAPKGDFLERFLSTR